jgi:hypothetical protein
MTISQVKIWTPWRSFHRRIGKSWKGDMKGKWRLPYSMSSLSLMRLSGSCRYAHDGNGPLRSTDTSYRQMMKESTAASGRTEAERAKKRYAELSNSNCGKAEDSSRLRTRIAYVQQSEEALAERRLHCASFSAPFLVAAANLLRRQRSRRRISKCYGFTWRHMNLFSKHV